MDAVTGAFGYTGRFITQRLLLSASAVRTLTDHPDGPNPFGERVELAPLAFDDQPALVASLRGVDVLYNTYWIRFARKDVTFDRAVRNTRHLVEAAVDAGARRIVHLSITNPEVSSVRDSDRIIGMLDSKTVKAERGERVEKHVLITRYDSARASRGEMLSIDDILEILATPLLGIIPESQEVLLASNVGSPVTLNNAASAPARAYTDAVRRLMGETVTMTVPVERKGLMNRLLGRRAA